MSKLHYFSPDWIKPTDACLKVDLCVYGATAAGVIAAVKAAQLGRSVVLLQPGQFIGGMTTGGLGWTDYGRKHVIGGMSRQFYRDLGAHDGREEEWHFAPAPAQAILDRYVADAAIDLRRAQYLESVAMEGQQLMAVRMLGGLCVKAAMFIDATYEGDLLAKAGVAFHVGREANTLYSEELNGIQVRDLHQFSHPVDPYVVPGDPSSGLLPYVMDEDLTQKQGQGDHRVQAYNFRVCMTDDPALKVDWARPAGYRELDYELANRWFAGEKDKYNEHLRDNRANPCKFDILTSKTPGGYHKTDTNNHGPVSSDFIGGNYDWPEGSYERREQLFQAHVTWQQGFYWHMANSPRIPERYREHYAHWGLPNDEYIETGHWPHQLYVREARRMVSDYVITEHDCNGKVRPEDPIGMASYTMDSHNCTRFVKHENGQARVLNDGDVQVPPTDPYPISYRAIVPARGQCENLLVPVCMSSSHIAFGSARMEPVFMVLGESAAMAAHIAMDRKSSVQDVPYAELGPELIKARQELELRDP